MIEDRYQSALSVIPADEAKESGKAIGAACARANLDKRANDGLSEAGPPFSATPIYTPGTAPGDYQFTPPYDAPPFGPLAVAPGWGNLTPFAFDLSKHEVPRPLRLSSRLYAADLNFVKAIGRIDSTTRTAEQSEIASFWYELSPPGWNRIANTVITQKRVGTWRSARILALVNFALADGYIAGFDAKYRFNFWRPITAIHMAALDGNELTDPDPELEFVLRESADSGPSVNAHGAWGGGCARCLSRTSGIECLSPPRARAFQISPDTIGDSRKPPSRTDCHASTAEFTF